MVTRTHLMLLLGLTSALIATWTYGSYHRAKTSAEMATAARGFLAALTREQKVKASLKFEDDERMRWHFIPDSMWPRKGIPFKELDGAQRKLAHSFLSTGLSRRGYLKATTIMSLEAILKELEQGKGPVRDSDLYFFSIFGEPLETQTWGWRVEGHHLSLNFTVVKGELIATAPTFFGSNPAEVKAGPRQGLRVLAKEEDLARELLHSLDESHRSLAIIMKAAPDDIITKNSRRVEPSSPAGLPASQMTQKQKDQLMTLLEEYAHNMPEELLRLKYSCWEMFRFIPEDASWNPCFCCCWPPPAYCSYGSLPKPCSITRWLNSKMRRSAPDCRVKPTTFTRSGDPSTETLE